MKPIEHILVPFDFGEPSDCALEYAVNLAKSLHARVFLLHVFEVPVVGFPYNTMPIGADAASRIVVAAEQALDRAVSRFRGHHVEVVPMLEPGDARDVILGVASDIEADLIVMGTHGRKGIARALIGSITESVVRRSTVPVVTIHGPVRAAA